MRSRSASSEICTRRINVIFTVKQLIYSANIEITEAASKPSIYCLAQCIKLRFVLFKKPHACAYGFARRGKAARGDSAGDKLLKVCTEHDACVF